VPTAKDPTIIRDPPAGATVDIWSASSGAAESTNSTSYVATDTYVTAALRADAIVIAIAAADVYADTLSARDIWVRVAAYNSAGALVASCDLAFNDATAQPKAITVPLVAKLKKDTYTIKIEFKTSALISYIANKRLFAVAIYA
jgi:hypothetical protein